MSSVFSQPTPYVQQPFQSTDPFKAMNKEWQSGLCSCCDDVSQCCYAYFCSCCFICSLADSINESKWSCFCVPYALAMYRMKIRSVLHIQGDTCSDYCATSFCGLCAAVQMRSELKYHGIS